MGGRSGRMGWTRVGGHCRSRDVVGAGGRMSFGRNFAYRHFQRQGN